MSSHTSGGHPPAGESLQASAEYYCGKVIPAMAALRKTADDLETVTDDELWSMPTYTELLFAR